MKQRSNKGASTRQRILETAAKLIYVKGVNGTSVDDVLGASGTGKSQFYHYFDSKEALVRELIDFHGSSLPMASEGMSSGLKSLVDIEDWLDKILTAYRLGYFESGCPIGNLASEMASQSEVLRQGLQAIFAHWESCLTEAFRHLKSRGVMQSSVIPESLALFCVAAIEGALLLSKTNRSIAPLEATIEQMRAFIKAQCLGASKYGSRSRPLVRLGFVP